MVSKHPSPAPVASGCTCMRLRKASRRVSQIYDQYLAPSGLTITQYGLLANLTRLDGISIGALAERLIMDPTTLTRNLRPLERDGLIELRPDRRDRRTRCLHLTGEGRARFDEAKPAWREAELHVRQVIGEADVAPLHAALDQMLERLSA